ncbi:hypothetical protein LCGC14_0517080 [marine sediment metagenome]|uniref:Uncharacterized protein n=1 Tax=marine sediment metagenome TaxID=412755 RepID=A0A0F9S4F9_9ZZZZ
MFLALSLGILLAVALSYAWFRHERIEMRAMDIEIACKEAIVEKIETEGMSFQQRLIEAGKCNAIANKARH